MRSAREIFPDYEEHGLAGYDDILNEFGHVVFQVDDDDDYEGDSRVLLEREGPYYGVLIFGFGSCSGCDALLACCTYEDLDELIAHFERDIHWFGSKEELLDWTKNRDWGLQWSWHARETKEFINKIIEFCDGEPKEEG